MKTGAALVLIAISKGFDSASKVSKYMGLTEDDIRRSAGQLERSGTIRIDRSTRPNRYIILKDVGAGR